MRLAEVGVHADDGLAVGVEELVRRVASRRWRRSACPCDLMAAGTGDLRVDRRRRRVRRRVLVVAAGDQAKDHGRHQRGGCSTSRELPSLTSPSRRGGDSRSSSHAEHKGPEHRETGSTSTSSGRAPQPRRCDPAARGNSRGGPALCVEVGEPRATWLSRRRRVSIHVSMTAPPAPSRARAEQYVNRPVEIAVL